MAAVDEAVLDMVRQHMREVRSMRVGRSLGIAPLLLLLLLAQCC